MGSRDGGGRVGGWRGGNGVGREHFEVRLRMFTKSWLFTQVVGLQVRVVLLKIKLKLTIK